MNLTHKKLILPCCLIIAFCFGVGWFVTSRCQVPPGLGAYKDFNPELPLPPYRTESERREIVRKPDDARYPLIPAAICPGMPATPDEVADAIFWAEGGPKTKYPYGVMGRKLGYLTNKEARPYCIATITNSYDRWIAVEKPGPFIEFLGNRYCPEAVDPIGYQNWLVNVRWFLKHPKAALP